MNFYANMITNHIFYLLIYKDHWICGILHHYYPIFKNRVNFYLFLHIVLFYMTIYYIFTVTILIDDVVEFDIFCIF